MDDSTDFKPREYRKVSDPSWRIQTKHFGEWVTVFYCQDEASADKCLVKCIERSKEPNDYSKILRNTATAREQKGEK